MVPEIGITATPVIGKSRDPNGFIARTIAASVHAQGRGFSSHYPPLPIPIAKVSDPSPLRRSSLRRRVVVEQTIELGGE